MNTTEISEQIKKQEKKLRDLKRRQRAAIERERREHEAALIAAARDAKLGDGRTVYEWLEQLVADEANRAAEDARDANENEEQTVGLKF